MNYAKYMIGTLLMALAVSPAFASQPIFSQGSDMKGSYSSQNDTSGGFGNFATTYDNFTLNGTYEITQISWIGSYFNPPSQSPISAWTAGFYTDAGGQPGVLCCSFVVAGNANETFLGFDNLGDPTYLYTMNVPGCCFLAGQQYWLSLVPDIGFPPQWGWESSSAGDLYAWQTFFGSANPLSTDMAFTLYGVPCGATPEPGTLALLGSGVLGLSGFVRRRLAG